MVRKYSHFEKFNKKTRNEGIFWCLPKIFHRKSTSLHTVKDYFDLFLINDEWRRKQEVLERIPRQDTFRGELSWNVVKWRILFEAARNADRSTKGRERAGKSEIN